MEQRTYRSGGGIDMAPLDSQELADFLVGYFDPQPNLQAQRIGQAGTQLVQIGRGDVPTDLRHAVTVAIAPTEMGDGIAVTMGQQQWLNPQTALFAGAMGLLGALVTPWALFALLWPLSEAYGSLSLPTDIWDAIGAHIASRGGQLNTTQTLQHPHLG